MATRKASIKETGEELSPAEWARFDAAVDSAKAERARAEGGKPAEAAKRKPVCKSG